MVQSGFVGADVEEEIVPNDQWAMGEALGHGGKRYLLVLMASIHGQAN